MKITLQNTNISFIPSFLGNGWETSLSPRLEKEYQGSDFRITFSFFKEIFVKIHLGQEKRKEETVWTTAAIAK